MSLNDRQARFVAEYLLDLNATQAAVRAGYSARSAYSTGERMLRNAEVAAAIAEAQAARSRRTEVTADRVVLELARVAFGDPRRVMSWGPGGVRLRPSAELADEEAAIVAEVGETTTKEGGSLRVKTVDKLGALRLLGRHLGMFGERADPGAVAGAPEPGPLETVADVRREAAELYRRACRGEVSAGGASRLAGLLTLSARVIEGAELEARLDALERRLGGGR
jgi:phage terminase small subunit